MPPLHARGLPRDLAREIVRGLDDMTGMSGSLEWHFVVQTGPRTYGVAKLVVPPEKLADAADGMPTSYVAAGGLTAHEAKGVATQLNRKILGAERVPHCWAVVIREDAQGCPA